MNETLTQLRKADRRLRRTRAGRYALVVLWLGLAFVTCGFAAYLPLVLDGKTMRAELARDFAALGDQATTAPVVLSRGTLPSIPARGLTA